MATSGSTNYAVTRADIIKRALRIIGAIGQGETPSSDATTEAAQALNEIIKEWVADGMQLWKMSTTSAITYVASTKSYNIGSGATINQQAPTKVLQAYNRNISSSVDTPLLLIPKSEYDLLGNKSTTGVPNLLYYNPPGNMGGGQAVGVINVYPMPDATVAAAYNLYITGTTLIEDFDATGDTADFPSYYYNALAWALADQLSYEYGVPFAQQAMITKKAEVHKEKALGYDREEGSVYLQPEWMMGGW